MQASIDHLVVGGGSLRAASDHVETALGVSMVPGGCHACMSTHNSLASLGPEAYVEALAPDPGAAAPLGARWFGIDRYVADPTPAPRLVAWALRVDDLDAALKDAPPGLGTPRLMERGLHRWRITVPANGRQPFDGVFPALIEWDGADPAERLPDSGARLVSLVLSHPDAGRLGWALSMLTGDDRVTVQTGPPGLSALIHTPDGEKDLR